MQNSQNSLQFYKKHIKFYPLILKVLKNSVDLLQNFFIQKMDSFKNFVR